MFDTNHLIQAAVALAGGYLLGSIPFGVIVTRLGGAGDVRLIGSGNIGATNVLRTGRRGLALLTLLGDAGKGALAVFAVWLFARHQPAPTPSILTALAGGAAFLGHLFPLWLGFKGGKGMAIFLGTLIAAAWPAGLLAGATWLVVAYRFRISSLAALAAAALAPIYVFAFDRERPIVLLALGMAVLIYIRHHENIRRLLKGQEPRIGGGGEVPTP